MNIPERLQQLRGAMESAGVDAYIITGSDPHGSEHPPSCWRTREWVSGFTGSAGTVVITRDDAGLWTDFRYWIQAVDELKDSTVELFRDGEDQIPPLQEWLAEKLPRGAVAAVDGRTVTAERAGLWERVLEDAGLNLKTDVDLINSCWTDRPRAPSGEVSELDDDESGESRASKLNRLKEALEKRKADTWLGVGLDGTAWLLNVRGEDVPYNPVVTGFSLVQGHTASWFTNMERLPESLKESLFADGVVLRPYQEFFQALQSLSTDSRPLLDATVATRAVLDAIPEGVAFVSAPDPVMAMKACKNPVEIKHIFRAMEKDGVAVVRFIRELKGALARGQKITELDAAAMLEACRSAVPGFLGNSFSPIPAYGGHGAICHYEATAESASVLGDGIFLIDSGGQWEQGTTDITRTVALTAPSARQRRDYTLTLKGHVALSRAVFPAGTRGYQLDTLARTPMWSEGINFGHGTGHGVGYRLNVHEGPQRISPAPVDVALEPGMVVSNEPGIYREDAYGIRIENLIVCRRDQDTEFGHFLAFDTVTLAPYDRDLIDLTLLTDGEIAWIDEYHARVIERLTPMLEDDEAAWLRDAAAPLKGSKA